MTSPYLTTQEAADVLRFTGKHAKESFLSYAKAQGLTVLKRGRIALVYRSEVLDAPKPRKGRKARVDSTSQP